MANYNEQDVKRIVETIATNQGFSDKVDIKITPFTDNGGYMSDMIFIDIKDTTKGNTLNLIGKISFKDEKTREVALFEDYFANEINIYKHFCPAIHKLQLEAKIPKPLEPLAKFYAASTAKMGEYVIMDNLKKYGFEMLGLRQLLDDEHVRLIVKTYGQFHGLSFALKALDKNEFEKVRDGMKPIWDPIFTENEMGQMMHRWIEDISSSFRKNGKGNQILENYEQNMYNIMKNLIYHGEEKYTCNLHGDCWSNNLLFRYKVTNGEKKLEDMKLVDFQSSRVGPPVQDLMYTLYSGATKEVLDNLDTYLKIYHESMANTLRYFNLEIDLVYPFHELKRQWKKYCDYGGILGLLILKLRSTDKTSTKTSDDGNHYDSIIEADYDEAFLCECVTTLCNHLEKLYKEKL